MINTGIGEITAKPVTGAGVRYGSSNSRPAQASHRALTLLRLTPAAFDGREGAEATRSGTLLLILLIIDFLVCAR